MRRNREFDVSNQSRVQLVYYSQRASSSSSFLATTNIKYFHLPHLKQIVEAINAVNAPGEQTHADSQTHRLTITRGASALGLH